MGPLTALDGLFTSRQFEATQQLFQSVILPIVALGLLLDDIAQRGGLFKTIAESLEPTQSPFSSLFALLGVVLRLQPAREQVVDVLLQLEQLLVSVVNEES